MKPARLEQIRTICAQRNSVPAMVTAIDELLDEVEAMHILYENTRKSAQLNATTGIDLAAEVQRLTAERDQAYRRGFEAAQAQNHDVKTNMWQLCGVCDGNTVLPIRDPEGRRIGQRVCGHCDGRGEIRALQPGDESGGGK